MRSRSRENLKCGHFKLLFCRGRQRNVLKCKTYVQSVVLLINPIVLWRSRYRRRRRCLSSLFRFGNVNTQRIGRPFGSVPFQPREELVITETVLVSIILFDLNRVKVPVREKKKDLPKCTAGYEIRA